MIPIGPGGIKTSTHHGAPNLVMIAVSKCRATLSFCSDPAANPVFCRENLSMADTHFLDLLYEDVTPSPNPAKRCAR
jgi:hypothetical protein